MSRRIATTVSLAPHPHHPSSPHAQSVGARRARIADAAAFLARAETENSEMEARLEGARRAVGAQRAALQVRAVERGGGHVKGGRPTPLPPASPPPFACHGSPRRTA